MPQDLSHKSEICVNVNEDSRKIDKYVITIDDIDIVPSRVRTLGLNMEVGDEFVELMVLKELKTSKLIDHLKLFNVTHTRSILHNAQSKVFKRVKRSNSLSKFDIMKPSLFVRLLKKHYYLLLSLIHHLNY